MRKINLQKLFIALTGIFFVGVGVAFNVLTSLGNDSIGMIYDGLRNTFQLEESQLGLVTHFVNYSLIVVLFLFGRRYLNIGTFIYILPYGFFVDIGTKLYHTIFLSEGMITRLSAGLLGCLLIYTGVSFFIAVDIGLDPYTGVVMIIKDKLNSEYRKVKIAYDLTLVIIGTILGGQFGIITVVTIFTAGPSIQWISGKLANLITHR